MSVMHFFRIPGGESEKKVLQLTKDIVPSIINIQTESCFNVEVKGSLSEEEKTKLLWLFTETFEPNNTSDKSYLTTTDHSAIVEVGPRLAFSTAWSSNCGSMCQACGILSVGRIERSRRYLITSNTPITPEIIASFASIVHDRMTECIYDVPLNSYENGVAAVPVSVIPVLTEGKSALEKINKELGI
jgi:phosphoribosylformylglycinamidine synthase